MHVSLDRSGRVVQSGEGTFRVPMGADQVDNTLSHPVSQAEDLACREREEYATMAALAHNRDAQNQKAAQRQAWLENLAMDYDEWSSEEQAAENGGESPLLYLAAMQTMAGGMTENYSPLGGYLLSQDGQLSYDRAMSGRIVSAFGQDVQSLIQSAQNAATEGRSIIQAALAPGAQTSPSQAPAPAQASSSSGGLQSLMDQKVGGIPVPYIAAGILALLILRK